MTGTKWYQSIVFKIILSVAVTAVLVNASFGYLYLRITEQQISDTISRTAGQLGSSAGNS